MVGLNASLFSSNSANKFACKLSFDLNPNIINTSKA